MIKDQTLFMLQMICNAPQYSATDNLTVGLAPRFEISADDLFVAICCDGIYDVLSDQQVHFSIKNPPALSTLSLLCVRFYVFASA